VEYAKLTTTEKLEFNDLINRQIGIDSLMQRLISEESIATQKKEEWFSKIRKKYNIPENANIVVEDGVVKEMEEGK